MKYTPKEITEEVNVTPTHPLQEFGYLLGIVVGVALGIYIGLGFAVEWVAPRVSQDTEIKIGNALVTPTLNQLGGKSLLEDSRHPYLETLLNELWATETGDKVPLNLHLVDSSLVNAAALAGGHIFVTTGFLEAIETENELTFVLAHELGHLLARDSLKALGRRLVLIVSASALNLGTSGTSGSPGIIFQALNLKELDYSRDQENAADNYGLALTIQRYGHGGGSLGFFERLNQTEDFGIKLPPVSEYFLTHPLTENRITELNKIATQKNWLMIGETTPLPVGINCPNFQCEEP